MSHIKCHKCGSTEHFTSFGLGSPLGGMGLYSICECGQLLEFRPDQDDLSEEEIEEENRIIENYFKSNGHGIPTGN
jgi:hypothetical protein